MATKSENQDGILPEEETLFREFQSYVRSIYLEASHGTIERLEQAAEAYKNNTDTFVKNADLQLQKVTKDATGSIAGAATQSERLLQEVTSTSTANIRMTSREAQMAVASVAESLSAFSQAVEAAIQRLNTESEELARTTLRCRQHYADLFDPAVKQFSDQASTIVQLVSAQKDQFLSQADVELKRSSSQVESRISRWEQESSDLFQYVRQHLNQSEQSLRQQLVQAQTTNGTNLQAANEQIRQQIDTSQEQLQKRLVAVEKQTKIFFITIVVLVILNISTMFFLMKK